MHPPRALRNLAVHYPAAVAGNQIDHRRFRLDDDLVDNRAKLELSIYVGVLVTLNVSPDRVSVLKPGCEIFNS